VPAPVIQRNPDYKVGIVSFGTNDPAIKEAQDRLAKDGIHTNYMRLRALPFNAEVREFILSHDRVYVVENNFDGQMFQLIRTEIAEDLTHMKSLALGDGLPMTPRWVHENILKMENN
jgi:2-oxoglutarate/2-oxoacid ferredoxin oxidoreductase subunit alpha